MNSPDVDGSTSEDCKSHSQAKGEFSPRDLKSRTYGSSSKMTVQLSVMTEGGSGTEVPALSIEVDDVEEAFRRMKKARFKILYPLTEEPWGVRRFFVRDPFGQTVNILEHL